MLDHEMQMLSELIDKAKINRAREIEKRGDGPETPQEGFYHGLVIAYEFAWQLMLDAKLKEETNPDGH